MTKKKVKSFLPANGQPKSQKEKLTGRVIVLALRQPSHLGYVDTIMTELADRGFHIRIVIHRGSFLDVERFIQSLAPRHRDRVNAYLLEENGLRLSIRQVFEFALNLRSSDLMTSKERLRIYPFDLEARQKLGQNKRVQAILSLLNLISKAPTRLLFLALRLSEYQLTKSVKFELNLYEAVFVLATPGNMRGSSERTWIRVSNKRKIPTAVMCLSWDNPTTKGVFLEKPGVVFAQSEFQRDAIEAQGFFLHSVQVVGSTQFESWVKAKQELSLQINSTNYIVYLGSSKRTAVNQDFYLNQIIELFQHSADSNLCLIIRPHPSSPISNDVLDRIRGDKKIQVVESELQSTQEEKVLFGKFIVSARAIFGEATSALLVSRIFGVQTFLMNFDDQVQPSERHLKALIESNYFHIITNADSLAEVMAKLSKNLSVDIHRLNGPWHPRVINDSSLTSSSVVNYIEDIINLNNRENISVH